MTEHQEAHESEPMPVAVPDAGVLTAISRAELDQQITTARAYPRSIKRFRDECLSMATLTEQVAEECFYALPRSGKTIEGPSARLAEIVASAWGNCRAGAQVTEEGADFVTARGVFHDLERNVQITMDVRRRITDKSGRRYNADMIAVTGNAACSIALRNAVFRGIPRAFWNESYEAARTCAVGNAQTLVNKRAAMFQHFQKLGATREAVLAALGVVGEEDIGIEQLATLKGLATAIKDGDTTVEQAFPMPEAPPKGKAPTQKGVAGLAQRVAATDKTDAAEDAARRAEAGT